jgi:hypothetical protein
MYKKTMTYKDFDGNERTEDFYFNFTKAELTEMELSLEGGLSKYFEKIVAAKDQLEIVKFFKEIVLKSYGEKSSDGKRFVKYDNNGVALSKAFSETQAYSDLYMELATNADLASKFFMAIIPSDLANSVNDNGVAPKSVTESH